VTARTNSRTPALAGLLSDPKNYGYEAVQVMLSNTPCAKRLVEPEEIGYAVAMLCADKAGFMNGVHLHVNGGLFID
jgi:NAD(P)-dependent dehydrogenase (short-subunit alcohol dehydrogenase family)